MEGDWPELIVPNETISRSDIRKAHAGYAAMIEKIDSQFKNVIDALKLAGEDIDDWIIVRKKLKY